ncbi:MAG TPA: serine/threonine-protein kinase, partial [Pseudomonadota bacterium]|nr:serine/threonine-protein kinase [Pseudomonadota bacterium]
MSEQQRSGSAAPEAVHDADMLTATVPRPVDPRPGPAGAAPAAAQSTPLAAQRIGRYAVLRQLGQGGMGVVLAAYDEELDRRVAVKLLRDHSAHAFEHRMRIFREAQAMARVSHPNVVQVYEVGEFGPPGSRNSHVFIAMEFIDGVTLYDWQRQDGRSWEDILRVYLAAGQGLLAAHESGLVHRDFKPDNVLVGSDQ